MDESVVRHLERQQVGTIKLSEAIRRGCAVSRPSSEHYDSGNFWTREEAGQKYACVIGAAWLGYGRPDDLCTYFKDRIAGELGQIVNDLHIKYEQDHVSREQCADWLEAQGY